MQKYLLAVRRSTLDVDVDHVASVPVHGDAFTAPFCVFMQRKKSVFFHKGYIAFFVETVFDQNVYRRCFR